LGERGGEQAHTLSINELPTHTHVVSGSANPGTTNRPVNTVLAKNSSNTYASGGVLLNMKTQSLANTGGSQAHLNMQPFLTMSFCIALQGIFPSPN
jgi:microcystin-dependent protein